METSPPPTLVDWIVARRAAGLPVVASGPRKSCQRLNVRAVDSRRTPGNPPSGSSTDRLSFASAALPADDGIACSAACDPAAAITHATPPRKQRHSLNVRAADRPEARRNPPSGYSTDRLSIADGFALLDGNRDERLNACFAALGDPTRRAMLMMLMRGERSVGVLAAPHAMSLAAAARHVAILDRAGLIVRRRMGRSHLCRLSAGPLLDALGWLNLLCARDGLPPAAPSLNPGRLQGSDDA